MQPATAGPERRNVREENLFCTTGVASGAFKPYYKPTSQAT